MHFPDSTLIRQIKPEELPLLEDLLYMSIYQADKSKPIPREVINTPKVRAYIKDFGALKEDYCLVAEVQGQVAGAVWIRIITGEIKGYGYIDDTTPEFAIALFKEYRKQGIGSLLMQKMIEYLTDNKYKQTSLSVQKANYALGLYKKLGFEIVSENEEDFVMVLKLGVRS